MVWIETERLGMEVAVVAERKRKGGEAGMDTEGV